MRVLNKNQEGVGNITPHINDIEEQVSYGINQGCYGIMLMTVM